VPRFLALGHVTWDRLADGQALGGAASYAAQAAHKLGCEAAVLTSAGPDFDPPRDLPGITVFRSLAPSTTRFQNVYQDDGTRRQVLPSRAGALDLAVLPDSWRDPDVLLLAPVAGEVGAQAATAFGAEVVGATAQGWLRQFAPDGTASARSWRDPAGDLAGVHAVFLSEHDLPPGEIASALLRYVPIVVVTRGWAGLTLLTRDASYDVPSLPREEVDPTGAGDVFAASFLIRYSETSDLLEAAAFGACAASCAVEGVGASTLGDRAEVERRMVLRERLIDEGEWEE
jgi:sugar/nucleoside kinase (ribokinase family)